MIKPLIPIIFLALWVILFEDKIWPDWESEVPVKIFSKGELQWEFDMDSELAKENYRFEFIQLSGEAYKAIEDNPNKNIYLLSQMIHNPIVNEDLLSRGLKFIMDTQGNQLIEWDKIK